MRCPGVLLEGRTIRRLILHNHRPTHLILSSCPIQKSVSTFSEFIDCQFYGPFEQLDGSMLVFALLR